MIRWCLNLNLISSGVYGALRSSGVLVLPSERTLRDYTHWVKAASGFIELLINSLWMRQRSKIYKNFKTLCASCSMKSELKNNLCMTSIVVKLLGL